MGEATRRPAIVGEVGLSHDGSLGTAHAYIDAIARAGGDGVKFQTHIASAESSEREPWRTRFSPQDASRYDYWERTSFTLEQWRDLREHAERVGLLFLSSPFSLEAVDLLEEVGVTAWKIASGETSNEPLLERVARTGRPVWISTGMSNWDEIDRAARIVKDAGTDLVVFQCTSKYPCPPEDLGLTLLDDLRHRYDAPVGLSDHSGTIYSGLAAATLGAEIIEVHVAMSREQYGPDVSSSITTEELADLVRGVDFIARATASVPDKDAVAADLEPLRRVFTKSLVTARALPAGAVLGPDDLVARKPGDGIPTRRMGDVVGRATTRELPSGHFLREDDLA